MPQYNVASPSALAPPLYFIPFQTGPSLDRVPDDILLEILSHLPTLTEVHTLFSYIHPTPLARTPALRALSRTSRLLRSRCLTTAWQSFELCAIKPIYLRDDITGRAIQAATRVLKTCQYLLPLIQTVSVAVARFRPVEIIPAFAECLATLPNLTTIQVICFGSQRTVINLAFKGKKFPSVRKIVLDCSSNSVHEIVRCCPNVEEVTFAGAYTDAVIKALIAGNCRHVRILKGVPRTGSLAQLADLLPNLKCIGVTAYRDLVSLASFPLLDTIEIELHHVWSETFRASKYSGSIKQAIEILEKNGSKAGKTVLLTRWQNDEYGTFSKKVLKVWPDSET